MKPITRGFTLVEVILYVALSSMIVTGVVAFSWNIILANAKSTTQHELTRSLRFAGERIAFEIRNAAAINVLGADNISLASPIAERNPTVIDLAAGRIRIGWANNPDCSAQNPCPITPAKVAISQLAFTNLSQLNSRNVMTQITGSLTGDRQEYKATRTFTIATELRSR